MLYYVVLCYVIVYYILLYTTTLDYNTNAIQDNICYIKYHIMICYTLCHVSLHVGLCYVVLCCDMVMVMDMLCYIMLSYVSYVMLC